MENIKTCIFNRVWLCEPKFTLTNRLIKRAFINELNQIEAYFAEIEESFNMCLFGENETDYDKVYQLHLKWWNESIKHFPHKLKYTKIKDHYFEQTYGNFKEI